MIGMVNDLNVYAATRSRISIPAAKDQRHFLLLGFNYPNSQDSFDVLDLFPHLFDQNFEFDSCLGCFCIG